MFFVANDFNPRLRKEMVLKNLGPPLYVRQLYDV